MISNTLNLVLFFTVVEASKAKAAGNASWLRAIEKAAEQIHDNPYMYEDGGELVVLSYSGETYHANGSCQCRAFRRGLPCWHRAAAQLMQRYHEAEAAQAASVAPKPADERATLIETVKAAWHRARPFAAISDAVRQCFGVSQLDALSNDALMRIAAVLR